MQEVLKQLAVCIERGKTNRDSKHPAELAGTDGAAELTQSALNQNISPWDILNLALLPAMQSVGEKFRDSKIFIPEVLIASRAMNASMEILKPYFISGELKLKGKIILGTVTGDLHDIGKNLLKMVLEGGGWEVIDLGVDVKVEKFVEAVKNNSARFVGLSALLTTTMLNMKEIIAELKKEFPGLIIVIGGAPVNQSFADEINADAYFPDPAGMLHYVDSKYLNGEL
jgi:5-methyltetrahydrofolate--homocysteine methyltransferase